MAKLEKVGIGPNLLLRDVEVTAPFLFMGEIDTSTVGREYLALLVQHRKNLKGLQHLDLTGYFHLCMAAHWATAGTFVPTNVDNQIREGLWRHHDAGKNMDRMARITIDSWKWDYGPVTNRKAFNPANAQVMSTHEGTWLSVAIGAYNALVKHQKRALAAEMADMILAEAAKEEKLLLELRERRDAINFLRASALMAHNFGDLDRVIDQWEMPADDPFRVKIYKLGHRPHPEWSPVLAFTGQVNKAFLSVENHRHMSLRQARGLRRSPRFLVPVGPFMDEWGRTLGAASELSLADKGEIVAALFEGHKRQDHAFGYPRAYRGMMSKLPGGMEALAADVPYDLVADMAKSPFMKWAAMGQEEFEAMMREKLVGFVCPLTGWRF